MKLLIFKVVIIMRKYLASIEVLEDAQIIKEGFIYIYARRYNVTQFSLHYQPITPKQTPASP